MIVDDSFKDHSLSLTVMSAFKRFMIFDDSCRNYATRSRYLLVSSLLPCETVNKYGGVTAFCVLFSPEHWALVLCVPHSPPHKNIHNLVPRVSRRLHGNEAEQFSAMCPSFMHDLLVVAWFLCFDNSTNE